MDNIYFATVFAAFTGLCFGSFSTMLIHRLHFEEPIWKDQRSHCPNCKHRLAWCDLFPLFSWIFLRGKCRYCKKPISFVYPLIELTFGSIFAFTTWHFWGNPLLFPLLITIFFTLVLFWYDVRFMEVDRRISWPAIAFVLLWIFFGSFVGWDFAVSWKEAILGGLVGFSFYGIQSVVSKGQWVGLGDLELGLFMGLVLGWKFFLLALFCAYIIGTVFAIPLLVLQKAGRKTALPMGAFLMPALLLMLFYGDTIWALYWNLI